MIAKLFSVFKVNELWVHIYYKIKYFVRKGDRIMNYFEFYNTQEDTLQYIERLKDEGYFEEDIHLVTEDTEFDALNYTAVKVHYHLPDNRWKSFFSKEQKGESFLRDHHFEEDDIQEYLKHVEAGQYLVVVDPEDLKLRESQLNERDEAE